MNEEKIKDIRIKAEGYLDDLYDLAYDDSYYHYYFYSEPNKNAKEVLVQMKELYQYLEDKIFDLEFDIEESEKYNESNRCK